jgi:hypothetical protein
MLPMLGLLALLAPPLSMLNLLNILVMTVVPVLGGAERSCQSKPGLNVMISKIFPLKCLSKNLAFFAQKSLNIQKWIIKLVFKKKANFFVKIGENRRS